MIRRLSLLLLVFTSWLNSLVVVLSVSALAATPNDALSTAAATTTTTSPTTTVLSHQKIVIVGAGPVGLFTAMLLKQQVPSCSITVLERKPRDWDTKNAFGIGINNRMRACLDQIILPASSSSDGNSSSTANNLTAFVSKHAMPLGRSNIELISRADLSGRMANYLETHFNDINLVYEEGCNRVDWENNAVWTDQGRSVQYDLLLACDGVNSKIRTQFEQERGLQCEHYLSRTRWKALHLPEQSHDSSFAPLSHPKLAAGGMLPRFPSGTIALLFWDTEGDNPENVTTVEDLKLFMNQAVQGKERRLLSVMRGRVWRSRKEAEQQQNQQALVFDDEALKEFIESNRPGLVHYMIPERYNVYDNVALLGDAAHGMSSLLGQGCACGFQSSTLLVEALTSRTSTSSTTTTTMQQALETYSNRARPEAVAITDLNLVSAVQQSRFLSKATSLFLLMIQALRGKTLFKRLSDPSVPFSQILKENRAIIALGKRQWKKTRVPLSSSSSSSSSSASVTAPTTSAETSNTA